MIAKKWNCKQHEYVDYELPQGCSLSYNDLSDITSCAECGRKLQYGDTYGSLTIHNEMGLSYPVCYECFCKEKEEKEQELCRALNQ